MTVSIAVEQLRAGLLDDQGGQVDESRPEGEACEQAERDGAVPGASALAVSAPARNGSFLCAIVAVQILWLVALGYGAFWLFS